MSAVTASLLAGAAAALAATAVATAGRPVLPGLVGRARRLLDRGEAAVRNALEPLRLADERGLAPSDTERLRLQVMAALVALTAGLALAGPAASLLCGAIAAWGAGRLLDLRRERYRRRVDAGVAAAAVALADALSAGRSVRDSFAAVAPMMTGAAGHELSVVARELAMGSTTERALMRMRARCRSRRLDLVVAAMLIQRRSGGSLATLLRALAATIDDQDRLDDEARAAIAQARFTSRIVLALPVLALALGEIATPGYLGRVLASQLAPWLLVPAAGLQVAGMLVIRTLGRVER